MEADGCMVMARSPTLFSRPLHGLHLHCSSDPTDESVGYCQSSARADWERLEVSRTIRGTAMCSLDELEDALWVYFRDAPTKTTSVNSDQATFLFIVMLQPN